MFDIKALYEAESVQDAIRLRQAHPEAQLIAGGSDVLIQIREGRRAGASLISIYTLDELRGVTMDPDGTLRIGPLTSFTRITRDPLIEKHIPVLAEAAGQVGGPQIRNIASIGGNICNGATSADSASTLLAWDAVVELTGPAGVRLQPLSRFYQKPGVVDIHPDELVTAILIGRSSWEGYRGSYIKYAMRSAMDIAVCGCSVNVKLSPDRAVIEDARIAYGVAGPTPLRCPTAEAAVRNAAVSPETVETFAGAVLSDIHPRDSWRASKAFREHIAVELARRALKQSITEEGGAV